MSDLKTLGAKLMAATGIHDSIQKSHPKLSRGRVWCTSCGSTMRVDSADCLRNGWPKCCGYTMTIDSPEERVRASRIIAEPLPTAITRPTKATKATPGDEGER